MCLQDLQIGRLTRTIQKVVSASASAAEILTPNQQRIAVTFSGVPTDKLWVTPDSIDDNDSWFALVDGIASAGTLSDVSGFLTHALHFHVSTHGQLPMKRWFGLAASEGAISIIEYILPEDVLSLTPDELRKRAGGK